MNNNNKELADSLANLAEYCKDKMGRNPYGIPEYKQALQALGKSFGYTGDWMDTLEAYKKTRTEEE